MYFFPFSLFTGFSIHHIIVFSRDGQRSFEQQLERLAPVLHKLTGRTRVVWWTQSPIIESYTEAKGFGSQVTVQKLVGYERSVRRIFRFVQKLFTIRQNMI